jgi:hypothetical protein
MNQLNTAILFILFNRTDTSLQVLQSIREVKPKRLYFFADGARPHVETDKEQCARARKIVDQVDWPCEIKTFFLEENLGPRLALGKGISWFFEHEEEGIILEHDCLPSTSFYSFCETLLAHYRDDERIMHISGDNFQFGIKRGNSSYYFSRYNHIWGFATWRRAWKHYDVTMKLYPEFKRQGYMNTIIKDKRIAKFWIKLLDETYLGKIATWDYQWAFSMWCQNGLAILPNQNLVSNIGFDALALNTVDSGHKVANIPTSEIQHIIHPSFFIVDDKADNYSMNYIFYPTIINLAKKKLKKWGLKI